jgi:hypothetical protein
MASAQYEVLIDFDKDTQYAHAQSDISAYVLGLTWNNGMNQPEQEFATPAQLRLTLDNSMGDFNLEDSNATFYGLFKEGLLVWVRAIFNSTMYTLFIGKLAAPSPLTMANYSEHTYTLTVRDLMDELLDVEFTPTLQTDVTTDVALKQPFDAGVVVLPYASSFWMLDIDLLDEGTVLLGTTDMVSFETGMTTLAYVGDTSGGNTTARAQQFLRDMVAAECGGRFFYNTRTGKFTFHNRYHDVSPTSLVTIAKDDFEDPEYIPQTPVINHVTVHYQPREVGAAGTVIYDSPNTIRLAGGETKTLTVRYRDATVENARIGAMDFINPKPGLDYIANAEADGSGNTVTARVIVSVKFGATSAEITLVNTRGRDTYLTTLQLRGTPLRSFNRESVTSRIDGESIRDYDVRPMTLTVPAIDDRDLAQGLADNIAGQHKQPHAAIRRLQFVANAEDGRLTQALARTIGDAITVTNTDYDHNQIYIIVGEQHTVRPGGEHEHAVTWILKTTDTAHYWILDVDQLDEGTILGF